MDRTVNLQKQPFTNTLHAIVLAFPVALYPSAWLADIAYYNTAVIQWTNFASWLIAGADLFAGILLLFAVLGLFFGHARHARGRGLLYLIVVAAMFVTGVVNAFHHARDGWHSVGMTGLVLSAVCTVLALIAAVIAYGSIEQREERP